MPERVDMGAARGDKADVESARSAAPVRRLEERELFPLDEPVVGVGRFDPELSENRRVGGFGRGRSETRIVTDMTGS